MRKISIFMLMLVFISLASLNIEAQEQTGCGLFIRGDSNSDKSLDLSDVVFTLNYLFQGGVNPNCLDSADVNDDGILDIADPIYTLSYLFQGGAAPNAPNSLGIDPTIDWLSCKDINDQQCFATIPQCGFGSLTELCLCGQQPFAKGMIGYCCLGELSGKSCEIMVYNEETIVDGKVNSDIKACPIESCGPFDDEYSLTTSLTNQLNPFTNMHSGSSIIAWESSENEKRGVYRCNMNGLKKSDDCEKNRIYVGDGFDPVISELGDNKYLIWQEGNKLVGCDLSLTSDKSFSCFSGKIRIIIAENTLNDWRMSPVTRGADIIYVKKEKDPNNNDVYSLYICKIVKTTGYGCTPLLIDSSNSPIDLPKPGDVLNDRAVYALKRSNDNYDIYYYNTKQKNVVKNNVPITSPPKIISLMADSKILYYVLWKDSTIGKKYGINIKLVEIIDGAISSTSTSEVVYNVITPGYIGEQTLTTYCKDGGACFLMIKIIGPFEDSSSRSDIQDGNFINELFKCDLTPLKNYDSQITSSCLRKVIEVNN